jgi:uncharacterized protein YdaU (DUF1376 family)
MAKDPAFLFYSKDWMEGTAEMLPEEKGVYIDLLAHQHQNGSLPADTKRLARIARVSHEEFLRIWEGGLSAKFNHVDNRLVNQKLNHVVQERATNAQVKRINGTLAGLYKKFHVDEVSRGKLKQLFKIEEFLNISTENLTETITIWLTKWLPLLENEIAIEDEDLNKKGGVGEKGKPKLDESRPIPVNVLEAAEMNQWTMTQARNTDFLKNQWRTFLKERNNDPPVKRMHYLNNTSDLNQYFLNWVRDKHPKNEKNSRTPAAGNTKPGRSEINDQARAEY